MLQILIVDDSLIIRKQIRRILEDLGHKVMGEAKNADEAVSMYKSFKIDLVTMDISMPGEDGISASRDIMAIDSNAKIIMVTSRGQEDMVVDAIALGAVGYILKPIIEKEQISKVIDEVFKKSE